MQLPKEFASNVPLQLAELQYAIARLELVTVDCGAVDIAKILHEEAVLRSAETIGLGDAPPRSLHTNHATWLLTDSGVDEWRLAVRDGNRTGEFMLVPVLMNRSVLAQTLLTLRRRLPYLELGGFEGEPDDRDIRGLHLTAMALLQGLLPEGV